MNDYIYRPKPPKEISFVTFIEREWADFLPQAKKGHDVLHRISIIQRELAKGRKELADGQLRAGFDWERDLDMADELHALNIRWLNATKSNNEVLVDFWRTLAKRQTEISTNMMIGGINLIVAGHGAAAIAALNALVSERGAKFQAPLIWTIFAACLGVLLVAIGKILIIEWASTVSNKITGKLAFPTPRGLRAADKYVGKVSKKPAMHAPWFIYGSLGWFAFYIFFALILVINA
jgi:TRAP-type C4-dicarboxylate transport system permease small subunit